MFTMDKVRKRTCLFFLNHSSVSLLCEVGFVQKDPQRFAVVMDEPCSHHVCTGILDEDCRLELFFLLDSSESAKDNHEQEKQFVLNVVDRFQRLRLQSGRNLSSRAALLQYSSHVITEQTFRDWTGTEHFKKRVAAITYIGHGTYTTYAITNMTKTYLEESNPGSIKVAVLLTDGVSHPRNPDIFSAVADAKNQGITFFVLGITRAAKEPTNVAQLRLLASSPTSHFLHNLQDEDVSEKIVSEIVSRWIYTKATNVMSQ